MAIRTILEDDPKPVGDGFLIHILFVDEERGTKRPLELTIPASSAEALKAKLRSLRDESANSPDNLRKFLQPGDLDIEAAPPLPPPETPKPTDRDRYFAIVKKILTLKPLADAGSKLAQEEIAGLMDTHEALFLPEYY